MIPRYQLLAMRIRDELEELEQSTQLTRFIEFLEDVSRADDVTPE
jgi:hypothetical protein